MLQYFYAEVQQLSIHNKENYNNQLDELYSTAWDQN